MNVNNSVLVVDDDADLASLVKEILGGLPVNVHIATTADQALVLFTETKPCCVFMDGTLVKGKGLTPSLNLVSRMLETNPETRIIAHSSDPDSNDALMVAGCCEEIPKIPGGQYFNLVVQAVAHTLDLNKHVAA